MAKVINGAKRGRPGRFILDWTDAAGVRRWQTFKTKSEADDALARVIPETRQRTKPTVDPRITLSAYAERYLASIAVTVKPRSLEAYTSALKHHILPTLGDVRVRALSKASLKDLLVGKLKDGTIAGHKPMARKSVLFILATLQGLLGAAIDDGIRTDNPSDRLSKILKLTARPQVLPEKVKAFDREQTEDFLEAIRMAPSAYDRKFATFFLAMARGGLRLGEAIGLQDDDVDIAGRSILVRHNISKRRHGTPKGNRSRLVPMSGELAEAFHRLRIENKAATLRNGWPAVPVWMFFNSVGKPFDEPKIYRVMKQALERAGLPPWFSPVSLRRTFASQLLANGESPQFVQVAMGHADLSTTQLYGKHLKREPLYGGVDALDAVKKNVAKFEDRSIDHGQLPATEEIHPADLLTGSCPRRGRA